MFCYRLIFLTIQGAKLHAALVICILHCHTRVSMQYAALNGSILCIFDFRLEQKETKRNTKFHGVAVAGNWADYQ